MCVMLIQSAKLTPLAIVTGWGGRYVTNQLNKNMISMRILRTAQVFGVHEEFTLPLREFIMIFQ